jgi:hypothetical protein
LNVNFGDGDATFRANDAGRGKRQRESRWRRRRVVNSRRPRRPQHPIITGTRQRSSISRETPPPKICPTRARDGDRVEFDPSDSTAQARSHAEVFLGSGNDNL